MAEIEFKKDAQVDELPLPAKGYKITYDKTLKGFGVRVTANGARAFILNYRNRRGQERRYTIGSRPSWGTKAARDQAAELKRRIDVGDDPMAEVDALREAATVADLCDRFLEEHVAKKRASTQRDYKAIVGDKDAKAGPASIRSELGRKTVAEIGFADIDGFHRKITKRGAPYRANRMAAVASKMFSLAIKWGWRTDNPAKGIERNDEEKRQRYLTGAEIAKLTDALAATDDQQGANIIRLLVLTGARKSEVLSATWEQFDLDAGVWTKPGSTTKQKTTHRIPLSEAACQLLRSIERSEAEFVFQSRGEGHRQDIKKSWRALCVAAGIVKATKEKDEAGNERTILTPSARIHDLRHTYASLLASSGLSLPIIGALLGHSQPATTARYAHLMDDPLRKATEQASALIAGKPKAEVVELRETNRG